MSHRTNLKCFLDFEYNQTNEEKLNLVSVSFYPEGREHETVWLYNDPRSQMYVKGYFTGLKELGYTFVCFNGVAEGHSLYSLDLNPTTFSWIDLQNEWKMFINHNHEYQYGKQLIQGKEKVTRHVNKFNSTEEELKEIDRSKPDKSLAAMVYKLLGKKVDTDHKDFMRRIIIANDPEQIEKYKDKILEYNKSDVTVLPELWEACKQVYKETPGKVTMTEILRRGRTSADIALMTAWGYPVDPVKMKNFAENVPHILNDIAEDINRQFPEHGFFEWNKARSQYSMKQKPWRDWIIAEGLSSKWLKTDNKGALSLSLDAFAKHFNFRHDYPEGNVGAQALRYLKTKQSMNGFMPKKKGETIFDSLGSDSRVRAWLNPYGAQSARFQPKATSYIPLKAAWMRSLIYPTKGKWLVGLDYSSEEFLISACWSEDENMYKAYQSGDVYLYFGKLAGEIPWDGTREQYKEARDRFKSTTLGISYLMGPAALAMKLTQDTGRLHTIDDAKELIDKFEKAYPVYSNALSQEQYAYYFERYYSKLPDGWIMYGNNPNRRSVANFPIQGRGSVILREAITKAIDRGIKVILPLHDALYAEIDAGDYVAIDNLAKCMREAFVECFDGRGREMAEAIRLDGDLWGPGLRAGLLVTTPNGMHLKAQDVYIDERSAQEYEKFSKYF